MSELNTLDTLYQELIIDHSAHPRNYKCMSDADCIEEGFNALCGDRLTLYLRVKNKVITEANFQGAGCAISTASASLMTEILKGKTIDEAQQLFHDFHQLMTGQLSTPTARLGKLSALQGVNEFPMRVKCATLPWHTMTAAIEKNNECITQ